MRIRTLSLMLVLGSLALSPVRKALAGEPQPPGEQPAALATEEAVAKAEQKYDEDRRKAREQAFVERDEGLKEVRKKAEELKAEHAKVSQPGSATVTIDDETKTVTEPNSSEAALGFTEPGRRVRDEYEVSPDDFAVFPHEKWSINLTDFKFDEPQYITASLRAGSDKTWWGFTFSVTNSTGKPRRIAPFFTYVTNKGVFNQAVGGFVPERMMADSIGRPLGGSEQARDKELTRQGVAPLEPAVNLASYALDPETKAAKLSPLSTFEPGQSRWGAALWPQFSNDFTELKIIVSGLSNAHRYEDKLRRVLVLTFARLSDEAHIYHVPLKLKDKKWDYVWMWDQDITVPTPQDARDPQIKVQKITTATGTEKTLWAFPFNVKNSTRSNQEFALNQIAFA
jgi:hypothetical protein